jgi:hypothetical protein
VWTAVDVLVGTAVGVLVSVGDDTLVGVGVGVEVGVSVEVGVVVSVGVGVPVGVVEGTSDVEVLVGLGVGEFGGGMGVSVLTGVNVDDGRMIGVGVGVSLGVFEGWGVGGTGCVGSVVGVRVCTLGTKIRVPARIKVELPMQLANCKSATVTPKASPMWYRVSPDCTV